MRLRQTLPHSLRHRCTLRPAILQATASEGRHAVLHDFCMTIPYGSIASAGGLVSLLFGAQALGWQVAGAGAAVLLCSVMSLKAWRSGGTHLPYTLLSAGAPRVSPLGMQASLQ